MILTLLVVLGDSPVDHRDELADTSGQPRNARFFAEMESLNRVFEGPSRNLASRRESGAVLNVEIAEWLA